MASSIFIYYVQQLLLPLTSFNNANNKANNSNIINNYDSTLEVGSIINFPYSNDSTVYNNTRTCNFDANYGYFENIGSEWKPGGEGLCEQSVEGDVDGDLQVTLSWTTPSSTTILDDSSNLEVGEGKHTFNIELSGLTASVDAFKPVSVYASTNTKKCIGTPITIPTKKPNDEILSSNSSVDITGKYKYFIGCYSDFTFTDKVYTSDSIRTKDVTKTDWMNGTNINYTITIPEGTKGMYIAIPEGIDNDGSKLKVKQVNTNAYVNSEMATNSRTVSINCGGTHTKDYKVFTWSFPQGTIEEEPFEITSF